MEARVTQEDSSSRDFPLPVIVQILKHLPANERALSGRFAFREAHDCLSEPEDCTASLAQPLPRHAAMWAQEAGRQRVFQLAFHDKPRLLCAAAASGSEVNVEAAWGALQPSFFFQDPDSSGVQISTLMPCPGVAAVRAGHPQLLSWLVRNCPGLLDPRDCVIEAGRHCDLAGLQTVLQAVGSMLTDFHWCGAVLEAAAGSATADAVAKLKWLLATYSDQQLRVTHRTVQAAVRSGDLGRLRWLRGRGWLWRDEGYGGSGQANSPEFLAAALQYADLTTVQWLMDEAGCMLPEHMRCLEAAIMAPDSMAKVQWLQQQGVGSTLGSTLIHPYFKQHSLEVLRGCVDAAVQADNMEVLLYLQSQCGPAGSEGHALMQQAMAGTEACPASVAMAQQLHAAGYKLGPELCYLAAGDGHVTLLQWLVREAGVSAAGLRPMALAHLIEWWRSAPRVLLEVVQLLLDAGYQNWDAKEAVRAAVHRGDLALTNYLLRLKPCCQPKAGLIAAAANGGCEALLEQLVEQLVEQQQQQEFEASGGRLYVEAAARGDRATLTALRRLGVPWGAGDVVVQAVGAGADPPALRWLVEQGAPVGERRDRRRAVASRTRALSDDVLDWLETLGEPGRQLTSKPTSATTNAPTRAAGTASDGGEGADNRALQQRQQQQQAEWEETKPDVAQPPPPRQQQQVQPAPCDGVGDAESLGAVGPDTGRVGRGGVAEERLAPGAEQERPACPEDVAAGGGADSATSEDEGASGGAAAPCAIDDPDWYADTFPNRFLDSVMAHQERIKAAGEAKIAVLQQQLMGERERAAAAAVTIAALQEQVERERERAGAAAAVKLAALQEQVEREREMAAAAAEAKIAALQQQLGEEKDRAAAEKLELQQQLAKERAEAAALQEQVRQLPAAVGSAGLPGQGAEGGRQRLRRQRQQ